MAGPGPDHASELGKGHPETKCESHHQVPAFPGQARHLVPAFPGQDLPDDCQKSDDLSLISISSVAMSAGPRR